MLTTNKLKPCPFCGEMPEVFSCDRLISISCKQCGYIRGFHGLVQSEINTGIPIIYEGGKTSTTEWYDKDAYKKAIEKWNRRESDD